VCAGNEERLTGKHETCDMNTFRYGVADRGSSIRIPLPVQASSPAVPLVRTVICDWRMLCSVPYKYGINTEHRAHG
jgi:hypothetical protein